MPLKTLKLNRERNGRRQMETDINKQRKETITNAETKEFAKSIGLKRDDIISINQGNIKQRANLRRKGYLDNAGRELMDFVKTLPRKNSQPNNNLHLKKR